MANLRDIKRRIRSVKNTGKITKAMQLVAASKMKKAQDAAIAGRAYAQLMAEMLSTLTKRISERDISHPMLNPRPEIKKRGILLISTDKGLCGGLNANLFRKVTEEVEPGSAKFITIGRKGAQFIARSHRESIGDFTVDDAAPFAQVRPAVEALLKAFHDGEVDTIEVLYTQFVNNLRQVPELIRLAPLDKLEDVVRDIEEVKDYTTQAPIENDERDIVFEPSALEILEPLLDLYLKREIFHMILEAKASEHSARMVAMKTATDNSKDLVNKLTLQYNKARQAAITQEILEISAASMYN